jgi:hypothetical protein
MPAKSKRGKKIKKGKKLEPTKPLLATASYAKHKVDY